MEDATPRNILLAPAKSDEWHTPPELMDRIASFLQNDFYDPCPARSAGERIVNGLWQTWSGRVYVNPPYGRAIVPWIHKAASDPIDELIMLVPSRTDTAWFKVLWAHMDVCFIHGRLHFSASDRAPFGSVLAYRGPRHSDFYKAFSDIGHVSLLAQTPMNEPSS